MHCLCELNINVHPYINKPGIPQCSGLLPGRQSCSLSTVVAMFLCWTRQHTTSSVRAVTCGTDTTLVCTGTIESSAAEESVLKQQRRGGKREGHTGGKTHSHAWRVIAPVHKRGRGQLGALGHCVCVPLFQPPVISD